ncbi:MAG: hypothetical protein KF774_06655 [Planctomyces sp.]|nr:hypothetical protein [Planctomyces sp.]
MASASLRFGPAASRDDGRTGVVEFWNAATGERIAQRPGRKVAFSSDNRSVAILDLDAIRIYDWPGLPESPRAEWSRQRQDLLDFALSPDGETVVAVICVPGDDLADTDDRPASTWKGRRIVAWDARRQQLLWEAEPPLGGRQISDHQYWVSEPDKARALAFNSHGSQVAVALSQPDLLLLLDAADGRLVHQLSDEGWRFALWFSPDGSTLSSARRDLNRPNFRHSAFVRAGLESWDVADGRQIAQQEIPEVLFNWRAIAHSPDGRRLAIAARHDSGGVLGLLNVETQELEWRQPMPGIPREDLAWPLPLLSWSTDGRSIAASLGGFVRWLDADHGRETRGESERLPDLTRMTASPDGRWLAVGVAAAGDVQAHVRRFDLIRGVELSRYEPGFPENVLALAVSPDSKWLAACDSTGRVRVWEAETARPVREFDFENDLQSYLSGVSRPTRRQALAFSPDGRWLAVCSAARMFLLDSQNGWHEGPDVDIGYDHGALNAGLFLPTRSLFVAARHRRVRAIALVNGRLRLEHEIELENVIRAAAVSPDGTTLALIVNPRNFADVDSPTRLVTFNTRDWTRLDDIELPESARINELTYLSDTLLACGENDGRITWRDASTGRILRTRQAHADSNLQILRLPESQRMATLGRTLLLWNEIEPRSP